MASVEFQISGCTIWWIDLAFEASTFGTNVIVDQVERITDVDAGPRIAVPPGPPTSWQRLTNQEGLVGKSDGHSPKKLREGGSVK
jgi:hypothetical protein